MRITIEEIKRETERAILATVEVENAAERHAVDFWFPKSQITYTDSEMDCPNWLIHAKLEEKYDHMASSMWIN